MKVASLRTNILSKLTLIIGWHRGPDLCSNRAPILGVGITISLLVCACHVTPESISSVAPASDSDQVWSTHESDAKPDDDLKIPDSPSSASLGQHAHDNHSPDANATGARTPGTVRTVNEPLRPIEGASGGRVWLLEMYQSTLAQKDELARRATDLAHERDAALARTAELEKSRADLEARNAGLATELNGMQAKALELARRLAESEIARLEAEKAALDGRSSAIGALDGRSSGPGALDGRSSGAGVEKP